VVWLGWQGIRSDGHQMVSSWTNHARNLVEITLRLSTRSSIKLCSATDSGNFPDDGKTLTDLHKLYPSKQNVAKQDGGARATGGPTSTMAL